MESGAIHQNNNVLDFNYFIAGTDFLLQNLTSIDVILELKE